MVHLAALYDTPNTTKAESSLQFYGRAWRRIVICLFFNPQYIEKVHFNTRLLCYNVRIILQNNLSFFTLKFIKISLKYQNLLLKNLFFIPIFFFKYHRRDIQKYLFSPKKFDMKYMVSRYQIGNLRAAPPRLSLHG